MPHFVETFVRPAATRPLAGAPVARLLEAEVPVDRRPLVEAQETWRAAHGAAARAMASAIASRDVLAFIRPDTSRLSQVGKCGLTPETIN